MTGSLQSGAVSASNTPHAADNLAEKRFLRLNESAAIGETPDVEQTWRLLIGLFCKILPSAPVDLKGLTDVLKQEYEVEDDFNKALFLALRKCLDSYKLIRPLPKKCKKPEDFPIVFNYGRTKKKDNFPNYAVGIAREVQGEQIFEDSRKATASTTNSGSSPSGLASLCRIDHCTCLLKEEDDGTWTVVEILSALELKISDSNSFAKLDVEEDEKGNRFAVPFLLRSVGPVAQVISYTMGWVLPSHSKLGRLTRSLSWAVVIGKKVSKSNKPKKRSRKVERTLAVSGDVYVPEECGDPFEYAVTGYVRSEGNKKKLDGAVKEAVALYLNAIYFGVNVARSWMLAAQPVQPRPTSGQKVMIGPTVIKKLKWRGSATLGKLLTDPEERDRWKINQGEIFTGNLNMHQIQANMPPHSTNIAIFNATNAKMKVVVKVFSPAVHRYLVPRSETFAALNLILHNSKMSDGIGLDVSDMLYAVYRPTIGLITVMADLSAEGYSDLKPQTFLSKVPLSRLWKAFTQLVNNILLPMARIGVVHPDIRPGFDVTANIMCQIKDLDNNQISMRLIDFESLVTFSVWIPPIHDFKFIKSHKSWTVESFVWWQCIAVAYAWVEEKRQLEMEKENLEKIVLEIEWLKQFRKCAKKRNLTAADVRDALDKLGEEFRNRDARAERRERGNKQTTRVTGGGEEHLGIARARSRGEEREGKPRTKRRREEDECIDEEEDEWKPRHRRKEGGRKPLAEHRRDEDYLFEEEDERKPQARH